MDGVSQVSKSNNSKSTRKGVEELGRKIKNWHSSGFFPQILFRVETSSVCLMSRKTDISQGTIEDLASKLIN